jgi:ankyrin repeat protein
MLLYRNAQVDIKDDQGYTPLMYAAAEHQPQIVAALKRQNSRERLPKGYGPPSQNHAGAKHGGPRPQVPRISPVSLMR